MLRLVNELVHRTGSPLSPEAAAGVAAAGALGVTGRLARSITAASEALASRTDEVAPPGRWQTDPVVMDANS